MRNGLADHECQGGIPGRANRRAAFQPSQSRLRNFSMLG
jgi:hypothetical protein